MTDLAALAEQGDEMCSNCGRARWRHHFFAEFGLLCPGNRGVGKFRARAATTKGEVEGG
jgi:hypothetical protein